MNIEYSQLLIKTLIVLGVSQIFRVYFETKTLNLKFDYYLKNAWIGAIIIQVILSIFSYKYSDQVFNYLLFSFLIYCAYKINDAAKSRTILTATLPLFFVSTLLNILETFGSSLLITQEANIGLIKNFALFWLIGFSIYALRASKKDRAQRLKEIEERQLLEKQKLTLEYQVKERTAELTQQKDELEKTVVELRTTQEQLVQSEKMASLGELTAGIAHEIQNPLNFVNNFSEISTELCIEIDEELKKENIDKTLINDLFKDLNANQEKISFHGNRASSIVKGMLMHSRANTGQKELTDINALADEFLRLAYHGLRAKDKSFQANFKMELDPKLPKVMVVPQDLGRVFLNLINNAFQCPLASGGGAKKVVVKTFQIPPSEKAPSGGLGASVSDNGSGISPEIKAKIFQPFFTTKPTGQGTGLGLSLAYDIITKGHGGTIECESVEGVGTEFVIKLPIT